LIPLQSKISHRLLVLALGLLVSLVAAELVLRVIDQPRFPDAHTETRRFMMTDERVNGMPIYVNYPGEITFTYDDNPRGYFGPDNEVHHEVNPDGFRGRPFAAKPVGTRRLVFLGDSFTFGEGVRLEHTYAEVAAKYLSTPGLPVEACNLGVGGYNTTQSANLLQAIGLGLKPDAVILGYVPNDAEPPLFEIDSVTGQPTRRNREALVEAEAAPRKPPSTLFCRLRFGQLIWRAKEQVRISRQTISYYRSLYEPEQDGWQESEKALHEIISVCQSNGVPCIVVMFPILTELSDDHPFKSVHEQVGEVVTEAGGVFVDLLPALEGRDAQKLWVHSTDQHPNERVHAIAGELIAGAIRALGSGEGN
jgi:hypothetical protein